jgi:cell wall integrity and stress response component
MLSIRFVSALAAAASLLSLASAQNTQPSKVVTITSVTTTMPASAMQTIGCFETGVPLEDHGAGDFTTPGLCQLICLQLGKNILGLSEGTNCWCGDLVPPESTQTDNSSCTTGCKGDKEHSVCKS